MRLPVSEDMAAEVIRVARKCKRTPRCIAHEALKIGMAMLGAVIDPDGAAKGISPALSPAQRQAAEFRTLVECLFAEYGENKMTINIVIQTAAKLGLFSDILKRHHGVPMIIAFGRMLQRQRGELSDAPLSLVRRRTERGAVYFIEAQF